MASGTQPEGVNTTAQVFIASSGTALAQTSDAPSSTHASRATEPASAELTPDLEDDGLRMSARQPGPSPEVERELEHIKTEYQALPALTSLPDFLSVNDVLALLPSDDHEYMRDELHAQLQNRDEAGRILGAYLDSEQRYFMLWVPDAVGLGQVLAIYDAKGAMVERRAISRGKPLLRDILELESEPLAARGYSVPELFIERITTMSVCCLPMVFEIYALNAAGKLRKLLEYPRAHTDVGPGVTWQFLNHFEFAGTRLSVSPVLGADKSVDAVFEYGKSQGRYLPLQKSKQPSTSKVATKPQPTVLEFAH